MKKPRLAVCVATSILGTALLASSVRAELVIQFGTTSQPGSVQVASAEEYVKRVNARLSGIARMELYHSSQLGSDKDMLQKVKLGTLDISQPSTITSTITPEFGLFDMPYLVKDRAHMRCIAKEIVWPILAPKLEEKGYKLLGVWENGVRQVTNNKRPIFTPKDLEGLKIRIPQGVWRAKMFEAYGAAPVPMGFAELFVALQTGVVDGQENPYVNIESGKFQEVQKYLSETNHVYTPSFPMTSVRKFKSYPEAVQKALLEEAVPVQEWTYALAEKEDGASRDRLIAAGMQFNKADREAFVAASKPVYELFEKEVPGGKALIDKALALAKGC
jgi:tripartite ATP-independent transporter DctP family solute receptor